MNSQQDTMYLIRVPAHGACALIDLPDSELTAETLAALLETDATERLRLPAMPAVLSDPSSVLCYYIDARGGDRQLPVNFRGTCFYHTGCPIYGDLLLVRCAQSAEVAEISGFTRQEADALLIWLRELLPGDYADS